MVKKRSVDDEEYAEMMTKGCGSLKRERGGEGWHMALSK